jgi:hypothetical protein
MRQAIVTKYHGPTNSRGSRISATAEGGRVSMPYNSALSSERNHAVVAEALIRKRAWYGEWIGGGLPNEGGNVFVALEPTDHLQHRQWQTKQVVIIRT